MGPPPWWDLSPAVTMRLHLLASLSGGGLAWRPGDRRWLAGEDQVWWALGVAWPGRVPVSCLRGVVLMAGVPRGPGAGCWTSPRSVPS